MNRSRDPRQRTIITPEGLALNFTLAGRGARFGALVLDLLCMTLMLVLMLVALGFTAGGLANLDQQLAAKGSIGHAIQFLVIVMLGFVFLLRNGWFLYFELSPRAATPGKRITGLRVVARDGGRLSTEMVLARNLMRDIELFLPISAMITAAFTDHAQGFNWVMVGWFLLFALFPFFNRDGLRAGDIVAGTWVVEAPRPKLAASLSSTTAPAQAEAYVFEPADLAAYGEYELQTLERVLRDEDDTAMEAVAQAICAKIGWTAPRGHEVASFLQAYYTALRGRLEQGMRFGQRKADKFER